MDLNFAFIFIILFRTFIPFTILRWPLLGSFLGIVADVSDVMIFSYFGLTLPEGVVYHHFDKIFDIWYLFFEFIIVMTWKDVIARKVAGTLFVWRFAGFLAFMLTSYRASFFYAPNIFEFFFIGTLLIWKYNPKFKFTWKSAGILLLVVGVPNIIKEYFMHFRQVQTWEFFKENLFWWLYD